MIGIQQSFQPEFLPTAKKLYDLGYNVGVVLQLFLNISTVYITFKSSSTILK